MYILHGLTVIYLSYLSINYLSIFNDIKLGLGEIEVSFHPDKTGESNVVERGSQRQLLTALAQAICSRWQRAPICTETWMAPPPPGALLSS